jgi:hypothetical protein
MLQRIFRGLIAVLKGEVLTWIILLVLSGIVYLITLL